MPAVPWFGGRPRCCRIDSLMTGHATIKPSHITEIIIEGQSGEPNLVDLKWSTKGIDNRQLQKTSPECRFLCQRPLQLIACTTELCQLLVGRRLVGLQFFSDTLKCFAMFVRGLIRNRQISNIRFHQSNRIAQPAFLLRGEAIPDG